MTSDMQSELRRALEDLNDGVKALLGLEQSRPQFVGELLCSSNEEAPGAREHGGASAAARSVRRRGARGRRGNARAHLVLVK